MIDIGNENINRIVAVILNETVDAFMPSEICSIHYSSESGDEAVLSEGIVPVCIDGLGSIADIDPDLERMAYNAHLTWEDSINGDAIAELERFKANRYDYLSSIALALSVKYKLADFGIVFDDNHAAAARLQRRNEKPDVFLIFRQAGVQHVRHVQRPAAVIRADHDMRQLRVRAGNIRIHGCEQVARFLSGDGKVMKHRRIPAQRLAQNMPEA